jgi:hypothetical protein
MTSFIWQNSFDVVTDFWPLRLLAFLPLFGREEKEIFQGFSKEQSTMSVL